MPRDYNGRMTWIVGAAILAAIVFGACWSGAGVLLHPPAMSPMTVFPEAFGLAYEKISFATRDGIRLKGWFLPSPRGDKRTILMCHGWGDNKGELLEQTYFLNEEAGFNLLYFDFRSHGESGGDITTSGGLETVDFDAAMAWLSAAKPDLGASLGVYGLSMGASVAVVSMPRHPSLRCAAVESPFADYRTVIARWVWNKMRVPYFPLVALTVRLVRWRVNAPEIEDFDPVGSAAWIFRRPLLVIGGERDRLMVPEDVKKVYDAAGQPKELWMIPGATHAKCREAAGREYDRRLTEFFSKNL
ncbi:MAG: dipeptidyl aminopeptidases/acylaminoacyl-peptidase [Elusimicrobia bacterium]|nr:MAG: dipeptidyl aminopeptidases/acylaminoacyl-peptidase [Elusimicrobiota bacterium]